MAAFHGIAETGDEAFWVETYDFEGYTDSFDALREKSGPDGGGAWGYSVRSGEASPCK